MFQQAGAQPFRRASVMGSTRTLVPRRRRWGRLFFFVAWTALALLIPMLRAYGAEKQPAGTTSRQVRAEASRMVPTSKLNPGIRKKVTDVVNGAGVFRRLPSQVIECDPSMYTFLVDNPDIVVNMWQVLGISDIELSRTGANNFHADDGAGTIGDIELVYRNHDTHVWYGDGTYEGSLFTRRVRGQCVLMLKSSFVRETDGRYYVTCRLDAWVDLENIGVDLLVRTFQPFVGPVADHNFHETASFLSSLNHAAEVNYTGVQHLASKLDNVAEDRRNKLSSLCEHVAVQAAMVESEAVVLKEQRPASSPQSTATPRPTMPSMVQRPEPANSRPR